MGAPGRPAVRDALLSDVTAICRFGETHVRDHYAPLIGEEPARDQVVRWWNEVQIRAAVSAGRVVVADVAGEVVGVGQRGVAGSEHVIYKLYVAPGWQGRGVGPALIDGLVRQLPTDVEHLGVEHFAGNARAGDFYEREGFAIDRIEPGVTPALDVVWRTRRLGPR